MDEDSNRLALSLASKLSVLELAFATLIERLALQTPDPAAEVGAFVQAVRAKSPL